MSNVGICTVPTPVYSSEEGLEFIAFPQTRFVCEGGDERWIHVKTNEYPTETSLFVAKPLITLSKKHVEERKRELPSPERILTFMQSIVGTRYLWGGNWAQGIPELLQFFPHLTTDDELYRGVDCSGLLFQASDGCTPRNTQELFHYGKEIPFETKRVQPLDMLVWPGHVLFILNEHQTIESRSGKGVVISSLDERVAELQKMKQLFSFRRWHPDLT